jgi:hypothetical protein
MSHYMVSIKLPRVGFPGAVDVRCFYTVISRREAVSRARFDYPGAKVVCVCVERDNAWCAA